jgi:carbon starvation protein CstA
MPTPEAGYFWIGMAFVGLPPMPLCGLVDRYLAAQLTIWAYLGIGFVGAVHYYTVDMRSRRRALR